MNVYFKVLCQKDYLRSICYFLTIDHIFKAIPLISKFHNQFINDIEQKQLIQTCIDYDNLKSAFESWQVQLTYDDY